MRIIRVEIYCIDVPLIWKKDNPHGPEDSLSEVLVRIMTDDGLDGWGETGGRVSFFGEGQADIAITIETVLAPAILGENPLNIEGICQKMQRVIPGHNSAKAAIDFAVYDLVGKYLGQPVYNLLGGRVHQRIPFGWSLFWKPLPMMLEDAQKAVELGYKAVKLKIGSQDWRSDLRNLRELRLILPSNYPLRVDANEGYSRIEAFKVLRLMEEYDLQLIEQPLPRWDLEGTANLRTGLKTPVMLDESIFSIRDAITATTAQACDIINVKPHRLGGLRWSAKLAAVAEALGIPIFASGKMSTSLGSAACAHLAAAMHNTKFEAEFAVGVRAIKEDIVRNPLVIEDGYIELSGAAGIGLEVDLAVVNRLLKCPPVIINA